MKYNEVSPLAKDGNADDADGGDDTNVIACGKKKERR